MSDRTYISHCRRRQTDIAVRLRKMVYGAKQSRQRLRAVLLSGGLALGLLGIDEPWAIAGRTDLKVQSMPVTRGVGSEVRTVVRASAERVAQVLADPGALPALMGTTEARVLGPQEGQRAGEVLLAMMRREPWPAGEVRWVERVQRHQEGDEQVVVWELVRSDFFRQLRSVWRVRPERGPDGVEQSQVSYQLVFELKRWVPAFLVRRSNQEAMVTTVDRLRRMSEPRAQRPAPATPATPSTPATIEPSLGAAVRHPAAP